jgi:hypothetical protein
MPILGSNIPSDLVEKTREYLKEEILKNDHIREVVGRDTKLSLTRIVYTGDYVLRGQRGSAFFLIAKFGLLPLAGCRGVVVFHHVENEVPFRGKGLGKELLKIRQTVAKRVGYSLAIATVKSTNMIERNLLLSQKWTVSSQFYNTRTGNWVSMYQRVL